MARRERNRVRTFSALRDEDVTILFVNQMANLTLTVAGRGYLLNDGRITDAGTATHLKMDSAVERAYPGQG